MGKRKEYPGTEIHRDKIRINFRLDGKLQRKGLDLEPTKTNLAYASKLALEIRHRIKTGTFIWNDFFPEDAPEHLNEKPPFLKLSKQYLATIGHLAPATVQGYRKILNSYFMPWLGNIPIDRITYGMLAELLNNREWKTAKTRNNAITPLRGVFELALLDGLISINPATRLKMTKHQKPPPDPLTANEAGQILEWIRTKLEPSWHNYFSLAFWTGLRTSELVALQWGDIDWRNETLRVQRAKVRGEIKGTKTNEIRDVELNSHAMAALTRQKTETFLEDGFIFKHPATGEPINDDKPPRLVWTAALKKLGIRHRSAYQTRHTFATLNIMAGANPMWVAHQMGHSNMKMTLERYARWIPAQNRNEKSKLENLLDGEHSGEHSGEQRGTSGVT